MDHQQPHWLWALDDSRTDLPWHIGKAEFEKAPTPGRPAKDAGPADPTLAQLGPVFVPHHSLVWYSLWLCLILDILKICMDFGPYDPFPSSDVPEMVDQQNFWNSLVIGTYLLYLEWNVGMFVVNICILWPPTPPHTHLDFCSSLSKRKELNPGDISKNSNAIIAR
jgi:hypothetical protein